MKEFPSVCRKCHQKCNLAFYDLYNLFDPLKDFWHPSDLSDCGCVDLQTKSKNRQRVDEFNSR